MSKIPTMDEMARNVAQKALDEVYYKDKSIREWAKIILSEDAISREAVFDVIGEWIVSGEYQYTNATEYLSKKIKSLPPVAPTSSKMEQVEQEPILDKIRAEIDRQEKWLLQAGYNAYNVDIAFNSIKSVLAGSEVKSEHL